MAGCIPAGVCTGVVLSTSCCSGTSYSYLFSWKMFPKTFLCAFVLVEANGGGCVYPLLVGAVVFPSHVCRDFAGSYCDAEKGEGRVAECKAGCWGGDNRPCFVSTPQIGTLYCGAKCLPAAETATSFLHPSTKPFHTFEAVYLVLVTHKPDSTNPE